MPPEKSLELIKDRENKFSHNQVKDIHERNPEHLIESYNAACSVVDKFNWFEVKCLNDGVLRTIDDIHNEIYSEIIKKLK